MSSAANTLILVAMVVFMIICVFLLWLKKVYIKQAIMREFREFEQCEKLLKLLIGEDGNLKEYQPEEKRQDEVESQIAMIFSRYGLYSYVNYEMRKMESVKWIREEFLRIIGKNEEQLVQFANFVRAVTVRNKFRKSTQIGNVQDIIVLTGGV